MSCHCKTFTSLILKPERYWLFAPNSMSSPFSARSGVQLLGSNSTNWSPNSCINHLLSLCSSWEMRSSTRKAEEKQQEGELQWTRTKSSWKAWFSLPLLGRAELLVSLYRSWHPFLWARAWKSFFHRSEPGCLFVKHSQQGERTLCELALWFMFSPRCKGSVTWPRLPKERLSASPMRTSSVQSCEATTARPFR